MTEPRGDETILALERELVRRGTTLRYWALDVLGIAPGYQGECVSSGALRVWLEDNVDSISDVLVETDEGRGVSLPLTGFRVHQSLNPLRTTVVLETTPRHEYTQRQEEHDTYLAGGPPPGDV